MKEKPAGLVLVFALLLLTASITACMAQPINRTALPSLPPTLNPTITPSVKLLITLSSVPEITRAGGISNEVTPTAASPLSVASPTPVKEVAVHRIPITGPVADQKAEVSGMAWYGDWLVLLPQYPEQVGNALYALKRSDIVAFLDGTLAGPLTPQAIPIKSHGTWKDIRNFEGFEAITFHGEDAYYSMEASPFEGMKSYLGKGRIAPDLSEFVFDNDSMIEAPLPVQISNFSNEALTIQNERLFVFYEANGTGASPTAQAAVYDLNLTLLGTLEMAQLEYRLTDATIADENGRFWVTNFFFLGDLKIIPRGDALAAQFGQGPTHQNNSVVERLVELQLPQDGEGPVTFTGRPPVQIQLSEGLIPRNWEGIVRLDGHGFLLITDKFPETLLGFVEYGE